MLVLVEGKRFRFGSKRFRLGLVSELGLGCSPSGQEV